MMLWFGLALLVAGIPALAIDRRTAHYFRDYLHPRHQPPTRALIFLLRTTDGAKGGPWIIAVALLYAGTQIWMAVNGESPDARYASDISLALLASFVVGSVVLHTIKLFLGRRRPRDDFEHGLYGFTFFQWTLQHNSFPSGHALTIFCVATWATALFPAFTPLWFAIAAYFGMSRAVLAVHFTSDVLIGAAIGVIATRETMVFIFPHLTPSWF
jgi:membrane-associated phospholipid phosphatase